MAYRASPVGDTFSAGTKITRPVATGISTPIAAPPWLRKLEPQLASETFAWQALCLRLAAIKCHARGAVDPQALVLRARGREAQIGYRSDWAERSPRTLFLLQEEAAAWSRSGPLRLLLQAA